MNFPRADKSNHLFGLRMALLVAFVSTFFGVSVSAQKAAKTELAASASLEQCRNGGTPATDVQCAELGGALGWVTGNAGDSNSHYAEDDFLPYRMLFNDLDVTVQHTVVIGYDFLHSDVHAIDYLGTYNATELDAAPCSGVALDCTATTNDIIATPMDPTVSGAGVTQKPGVFTLFGGDLISATLVPCTSDPVQKRCVSIVFTASVPNPVLAWSGHVAWAGDWGAGNSAGGISGSPYHMRLVDLDGQGGNQDRSLSADAVVQPGALVIVKSVASATGASVEEFSFTATDRFNPLTFVLVDNNVAGPDRKTSLPINATTTITVTEAAEPTFTVLGIMCDNGVQGNIANRNVTVNVAPGQIVTCTFTNGSTGPSAAPATISGRVINWDGTGISGARITVTNAETGEVVSVLTNPFGYYTTPDLAAGQFYIAQVSHRRYQFADNSRAVTLDDNISDLDFIANP